LKNLRFSKSALLFLFAATFLSPVAKAQDYTSTTILGLEKPNIGDVTNWGVYENSNMDLLDAILGHVVTVDGVRYPCSDIGINQAISDAISNRGETVDVRGCASLSTYRTEIDVGNGSVPITLILPPSGTWLCNVTGGASKMCLRVFNNSAVIGSSPVFGSFQIRPASSSMNVGAMCGNDTSIADAHIRMEGFSCNLYSGTGTVSNAVGTFSGLGDGAYVGHMTFGDLGSTNATKVFWVNNSCCSATFENIVAEAFTVSGVTPCFFGNGTTGPNLSIKVTGLACTHAGNGASQLVDQEWNQYGNNTFTNIYMETCPTGCFQTLTDLATPWVSVQAFGTPSAADYFLGITAGGDVASSTRYVMDLASGTHAIIQGLEQGNVSSNLISDHNRGLVISAAPSTTIAGYSTEKAIFTSIYAPTLLCSSTSPTISFGFNVGSISLANGTCSFSVTVGTGTAGSTGVLNLPAATGNGWTCTAQNLTRIDFIQQTGVGVTSATLTNLGTTFTATNWTNGDQLLVNCFGR
jgi:hypothetical protein